MYLFSSDKLRYEYMEKNKEEGQEKGLDVFGFVRFFFFFSSKYNCSHHLSLKYF